MWHELQEEAQLELAQIKVLITSFRPLFKKVVSSAPDTFETVALAGFLHAFYTGTENIFKRIALHVDGGLPSGGAWHS